MCASSGAQNVSESERRVSLAASSDGDKRQRVADRVSPWRRGCSVVHTPEVLRKMGGQDSQRRAVGVDRVRGPVLPNQGSRGRRTCLFFELWKRGFVDCSIMKWSRLAGITERQVQAQVGVLQDRPCNALAYRAGRLEGYKQRCRREWLAGDKATAMHVNSVGWSN